MQDKRTVLVLADALAEITGSPASTLRQLSRRTREAGFLSQAGHGRAGAPATSRDCATMLLVSMATDIGHHAGPVAEALSAFELGPAPNCEVIPKPETLGVLFHATDLIGLVAECIDALRRQDENFVGVAYLHMVNRGNPCAMIAWGKQEVDYGWHFRAPEDSPALAGYQRVMRQRSIRGVRRVVDADGWILGALADWLEGREAEL